MKIDMCICSHTFPLLSYMTYSWVYINLSFDKCQWQKEVSEIVVKENQFVGMCRKKFCMSEFLCVALEKVYQEIFMKIDRRSQKPPVLDWRRCFTSFPFIKLNFTSIFKIEIFNKTLIKRVFEVKPCSQQAHTCQTSDMKRDTAVDDKKNE